MKRYYQYVDVYGIKIKDGVFYTLLKEDEPNLQKGDYVCFGKEEKTIKLRIDQVLYKRELKQIVFLVGQPLPTEEQSENMKEIILDNWIHSVME